MLRTGEILGILSSHIECGPGALQALINLGLTKGGKRLGAAESVVLGFEPVVKVLTFMEEMPRLTSVPRLTPRHLHKVEKFAFNQCLEQLSIQ